MVGSVLELRSLRRKMREAHSVVGFVPTMGALHMGHQALMRRARAECDQVVVSIFVNPTQFGPGEDFEAYPRTEEADLELCREAAVDVVWLPQVSELYPPHSQSVVELPEMGSRWEGASRPHHFRGVATVVTKLFHVVEPERAYFGEKDRQQLELLKALVRDLLFPIQVTGVATERDARGLALSSRNFYLTENQRERASMIRSALLSVERSFRGGENRRSKLFEVFCSGLEELESAKIERVDFIDRDFQKTYEDGEKVDGGFVCVAVRYAGVRLIDEIELDATNH